MNMTEGNIYKLLLLFSLPMLLGNVFQQVYNLVDSIVVGNYVGKEALGAVGSVGSLTFLFFSFAMGLGNGMGVLVAQYFGAGKDSYVKKIIPNAFYVTLVAGVMVSILAVTLARPILTLMHTPIEDFEYACTYLQIVGAATFVVAIYNLVSAILRALGDSKTPLYFLVVASILNVGLDLLFVVAFHMEVAGVAYATIISQALSAVGSFAFAAITNPYFKLSKEDFKPDKELMMKGIKLGLPLAAQGGLIAFSCIVLQAVVNSYGPDVMAAFTATTKVEQLVQQPYGTISIALSNFTGQNIGAGKIDRVKEGFKKGTIVVVIFSLIMIVVMNLFGDNIISMFIKESEVVYIGAMGLKITCFMYLGLGMIYVARGMLNGAGDSMFSMLNGVCEVVCRVGFALILMNIPFIGMWGLWWTNGGTWILTAIMSVTRFFMGKWKSKAVVN